MVQPPQTSQKERRNKAWEADPDSSLRNCGSPSCGGAHVHLAVRVHCSSNTWLLISVTYPDPLRCASSPLPSLASHQVTSGFPSQTCPESRNAFHSSFLETETSQPDFSLFQQHGDSSCYSAFTLQAPVRTGHSQQGMHLLLLGQHSSHRQQVPTGIVCGSH